MFPIVFAAISGRSLKMVARYLAERGAKISVRNIHWHKAVPPTEDTSDTRATHGQPVCLGYNRESNSDATYNLGWREPPVSLGIVPSWWSSFSPTHEEV
jgi:hypothetical protein